MERKKEWKKWDKDRQRGREGERSREKERKRFKDILEATKLERYSGAKGGEEEKRVVQEEKRAKNYSCGRIISLNLS